MSTSIQVLDLSCDDKSDFLSCMYFMFLLLIYINHNNFENMYNVYIIQL